MGKPWWFLRKRSLYARRHDAQSRQSDLLEKCARAVRYRSRRSPRFGVTLQTVRRDVRCADEAACSRFHAAMRAQFLDHREHRLPPARRLNAESAKRASRARVAARVPENCSLIINIGTTTEAIARELLRHKGLRVITNNLNVAASCGQPDCEVIVAGGVVRPATAASSARRRRDFIAQFKVDIALIGISAIESDGTLRDFDYREVKVARPSSATRARSGWRPTTASSTARRWWSWRTSTRSTRSITDAEPPAPFASLLAEAGVTLHIAP